MMTDEGEDRQVRSRANTRAQLIRAGRRLFFARDFADISVDRVSRDAGFTRAAFYLHFPSRDDLIAAIMLGEVVKSEPIFRWFETHPRDPVAIRGFILAIVAAQRQLWSRPFHIAALRSRPAQEAFRCNRERLMTVLGESFPAFRPIGASEPAYAPADHRRLARATNAMVLLEQISMREAEMLDPPLVDAMIADLADLLQRLDFDYP